MMSEEFVNTYTILAWTVGTKINFLMTSLASKARWACTLEVIDKISAVGSQQARTLGTII